MKIKNIISQHRRDFTALYECEGCGHVVKAGGYDDDNFHRNVIPGMVCKKCEKSGRDIDADYRPLTPKYPEGFQI
jgi:hypothetical protein